MNKVQTYLDDTVMELLSNYADKSRCSLSHAAAHIMTSFLIGEDQASKIQAENKQQFLRLLNVLNQVLMCVYDSEKVSVDSQSARECLDKIKASLLESEKH